MKLQTNFQEISPYHLRRRNVLAEAASIQMELDEAKIASLLSPEKETSWMRTMTSVEEAGFAVATFRP
jgi:hypothetical protein